MTATEIFQPKGDRPQWEMVLDRLNLLEIGDIITYEELDQVLGVDSRRNRTALRKAEQVWGRERLRALACVRNIGYRVVSPNEHERLGHAHHRKGRRSVRRARVVVQNADRSLLTVDEQMRMDNLQLQVGRHESMLGRLDRRVTRVEAAISESRQTSAAVDEQTQARLAKLENALRRHGLDAPE